MSNGRFIVYFLFSFIVACSPNKNIQHTFLQQEIHSIKTYVQADQSTDAEITLLIRAGSLQEQDDELGYAHFVEHMAFNGTRDFPKDKLLEHLNKLGLSIGRHTNARTSFDSTVYTIKLDSVDDQRLELAIELLAQWAQYIEFDADAVQSEIPVILEEWRMREPLQARAQAKLRDKLYAGSRYAERMPIGTVESIKNATAEKLQAFYKRWYQPNNTVLILTGNINVDKAKSLIEEKFSDTAASAVDSEPKKYDIKIPSSGLVIEDEHAFGSLLSLNWFNAHRSALDKNGQYDQTVSSAGLEILEQRLKSRYMENPGAISGLAVSQRRYSPNVMSVSLGMQLQGSSVKDAMQLASGIWKGLLERGITEHELSQWRTRKLEQASLVRDNPQSLTFDAIHHTMYQRSLIGKEEWSDYLHQHLPRLKVSDINSALKEFIGSDPEILLISKTANKDWSLEQLKKLRDESKPLFAAPDLSAEEDNDWPITPNNSAELLSTNTFTSDVTQWTFSNGLIVHHRFSDVEPGVVAYKLLAKGGMNQLDKEQTIHARLALQTIGASGLRHFNGPALSQWLSAENITLQPQYRFFSKGVTGGGPVSKFPLQMRLLYIALTEGRVDEKVWQHFQIQNTRIVKQLGNDPKNAWTKVLEEVLYRQDPGLRTLTLDEIKGVSKKDALALYHQTFSGSQQYVLNIVGDLSAADALDSVQDSVAMLKEQTQAPSSIRSYPREERDMKQSVTGNGQREALGMLRYSVDKQTSPYSVSDMGYLSQWLSEVLFQKIREDLGLVYKISAQVDGAIVGQDAYTLIINYSCDPKKNDQVVEAIELTLASLSAVQPKDSQIAVWRKTTVDALKQQMDRLRTQVAQLAYSPIYGRPVEGTFDFDERSKNAEADMFMNALKAFRADEAVRVELVWLP